MAFQPAWAVQGGQASASVARALAFASTGGRYGAGVAEPEHLRVVANGTSSVSVEAGAAIIPSRYSGDGVYSSYAVVNDAAVALAVPATPAGSTATRYVIARIDDPNFGGTEPPNRATAPFSRVELVSSITNLPYPFLALARINQPASTSAITQAMVTDLRKMSSPRRSVEPFTVDIVSTVKVSTGTSFQTVRESPNIEIPEWATHATIIATWSGITIPDGDVNGQLAVLFASQAGDSYTPVAEKAEVGRWERSAYATAGKYPIASQFRGTQQKISFRARRTSAAGSMQFDGGTSFVGAVYFSQEVV